MKSKSIAMFSMIVAGVIVAAAGGPSQDAERQLKTAMNMELVDGNLRAAIEQYKKVAQSGNRALAAQALVHMAECYQKLGDAEAQRIYQRIVRDYADQKEAVAVARSRVSNKESAAAIRGDRAVWTGSKVDLFGQVSPDGRFLTYVDWGGDQNLILHDLNTGADRPLTATGPSVGFSQLAEFSTVSRDGKQVAYAWFNDKGVYDLRLVPLDATGVPKPRVFFPGNDEFSISPFDWSPDGKWIAVNIRRKDGSGQIGLVGVADGALRVLKSVDWRGANKIMFSPDGRFIAYDVGEPGNGDNRTVYVMAVDGSGESAVAAHPGLNVVMAWSPDGRQVLFASDRGGTMSLWAQPVTNGRPTGEPTMIRRDIGSAVSLGLTSNGALLVYKAASANYIDVAALDLVAGTIRSASTTPLKRFVGGGGLPRWSPDGKELAYRWCGFGATAVCNIEVATPQTGQTRRLPARLGYFGDLRFARDQRSFFTTGRDFKGRQALFRLDGRTGEPALLFPRPGAIEQWAPDEQSLYFRRGGSIFWRDVSSGTEREIFGQRAVGNSISIKVSPDGLHLASVETAGTSSTLLMIPASGGTAPRELWRTQGPERLDGFRLEWTPDGRAVIVPKLTDGRIELWLVSVADGHQPRKLDVDASDWVLPGGGFAIHPDGRQLAFTAASGKQGPEVWVLENVLASLSARK